ncbi:hypothetical protein Pelo_6561 [Pelomyxa schiedti]|nr:hypothetical protein Pelo_6561 [Pelomyxa schiedti]
MSTTGPLAVPVLPNAVSSSQPGNTTVVGTSQMPALGPAVITVPQAQLVQQPAVSTSTPTAMPVLPQVSVSGMAPRGPLPPLVPTQMPMFTASAVPGVSQFGSAMQQPRVVYVTQQPGALPQQARAMYVIQPQQLSRNPLQVGPAVLPTLPQTGPLTTSLPLLPPQPMQSSTIQMVQAQPQVLSIVPQPQLLPTSATPNMPSFLPAQQSMVVVQGVQSQQTSHIVVPTMPGIPQNFALSSSPSLVVSQRSSPQPLSQSYDVVEVDLDKLLSFSSSADPISVDSLFESLDSKLPALLETKHCDTARLSKKIQSTCSLAVQHSSTMAYKTTLDLQIQGLVSGMWTVTTEHRTASGVCGCGHTVSHTYHYNWTSVNETVVGQASAKIKELHDHIFRPVFLSLYEETMQELALSLFLARVSTSLKEDTPLLRSVLSVLFAALQREDIQRFPYLTTAIESSIVSLGATLSAQHPQDNLLLLDSSSSPETGSLFLLSNLLKVNGLHWGSSLLGVSDLKQLVYSKGLHSILSYAPSSLEEPFCAFLSQLKWPDTSLLKPEDIESILLPLLQDSFVKCLQARHFQTALWLGKIITVIANIFPKVSMTCLLILTRSPWPSKMLCSSLISMFPWHNVSAENLISAFGELYHLFGLHPDHFAVQPPAKKNAHRTEFVNFLLNQESVFLAYKFDPVLSAAFSYPKHGQFPLLSTFSQLALCSASISGHSLHKVIISELFWMAFVCNDSSPFVYLKTEAMFQLAVLVKLNPALFSLIIASIGGFALDLQITPISAFITQLGSASCCGYSTSSTGIVWISHFLAHTPPPLNELTFTEPISSPAITSANISTYLFQPAAVQMQPQISSLLCNIGCQIVQAIDWSKSCSIHRFQVILLILASGQFVSKEWVCTFFCSMAGLKLFEGPHDPHFIDQLLRLNPSETLCPSEVDFVQSLLLMNLCSFYSKTKTGPQLNSAWLAQSGLFTRLKQLFVLNKSQLFLLLLPSLVSAISEDPSLCMNDLELLVNSLPQAESLWEPLSKSLSSLDQDAKSLVWARLLCKMSQLHPNPPYITMLETLLLSLFKKGTLSSLAQNLRPFVAGKTKEEIITLSKQNFICTALLFLLLRDNVVPSPNAVALNDISIKETSLYVLCEICKELKSDIRAIPFYDLLWPLYFQFSDRGELLDIEMKTSLGTLWAENSQVWNANRQLSDMFDSFLTWKRETILKQGRLPQESLLCFTSIARSPIPISPPSSSSQVDVIPPQVLIQKGKEVLELLLKSLSISTLVPQVKKHLSHLERILITVDNTVKAIKASSLNEVQSDNYGEGIPLVRCLYTLMDHFTTLKKNLQHSDEELLSLAAHLYTNLEQPYSMEIECTTRPCKGAAVLKCSKYSASMQSTEKEAINKNRSHFTSLCNDIRHTSRSLSYVVFTVLKVIKKFTKDPKPGSESSAIHLFFNLAPLALQQTTPPHSPFFTDIVTGLMQIGNMYIANRPPHQMRLLMLILQLRQGCPECTSLKAKPSETVSTTNSGVRFFSEDHRTLFQLFTPLCCLQSTETRDQFYLLIEAFVGASNQLANSDNLALSARFEISSEIHLDFDDHLATTLLSLFPSILHKEYFDPLSASLLQAIAMFHFPQRLPAVIHALFSAPKSNVTDMVLAHIDWDKIDLQSASDLIAQLSLSLSSPTQSANDTLVNVARKIFTSKVYMEAISSSVSHGISASNVTGSFPGVTEVMQFIQNCLTSKSMATTGVVQSITSLLQSVFCGAPALLQCFWQFLYSVVIPSLSGTSADQTQPWICLIRNIPAELWSKVSFHHKEEVISQMIDLLFINPDYARIVIELFATLDWELFLSSLPFAPAQVAKEAPHPPVILLEQLFGGTGHQSTTLSSAASNTAPLIHLDELPPTSSTSTSAFMTTSTNPTTPVDVTPSAFMPSSTATQPSVAQTSLIDISTSETQPTHTTTSAALTQTTTVNTTPSSAPAGAYHNESKLLLAFLKLFISVYLLHPDAISKQLILKLCNPRKNGRLVEWWRVEMDSFSSFFDSSLLLRLVKAPTMLKDPSGGIVDMAKLLHDVAVESRSPYVVCTAVQEARNVMFLLLKSTFNQKMWNLGLADHTGLMRDVMLPLVRFLGTLAHLPQSQPIFPKVLQSILSCLEIPLSEPILAPAPFAKSETGELCPGPPLQTLEKKLSGLILQFCASCTPETALQILSSGAECVVGLSTLVTLLEETLRSYFTQSESENAVNTAATAFRPPPVSLDGFALACSDNHTALTLYIYLDQQRRGGLIWPHLCVLAEKVISFCPSLNHEVDMLALWFLILGIVADDQWINDKNSDAVLQSLHRHLQSWATGKPVSLPSLFKTLSSSSKPSTAFTTNPRIQLAARSCRVYLARIYTHKTKDDPKYTPESGALERAAAELESLRNQLLALRDDPSYRDLRPFFDDMENICSPLCTMFDFKSSVAKHLCPTAPYLAHL